MSDTVEWNEREFAARLHEIKALTTWAVIKVGHHETDGWWATCSHPDWPGWQVGVDGRASPYEAAEALLAVVKSVRAAAAEKGQR